MFIMVKFSKMLMESGRPSLNSKVSIFRAVGFPFQNSGFNFTVTIINILSTYSGGLVVTFIVNLQSPHMKGVGWVDFHLEDGGFVSCVKPKLKIIKSLM